MNGIDKIVQLNSERADYELSLKESVNKAFERDNTDRLNELEKMDREDVTTATDENGPQCGHDICERIYAVEQKTDPVTISAIKAAADTDPILSMALLLANVLDHDEVDLANRMMSQVVAKDPIAGLAVLAQIMALIDDGSI